MDKRDVLQLCNVCHNEDPVAKYKAGCGHLIRVCNECDKDRKSVQHQPCDKCNGTYRAYEREIEEEKNIIEYEDSLYGDGFDYDWDEPFDLNNL